MGWDADPTVWADVLCGRKKVTAQLFPRLLYSEGHVYNPYDMEDGLLRNHILVRNAKHIFMGPASALRGPGYKKGRASLSKIIGMSRITPRALAYTIVQSRFSISDAQEWHTVDRDFNYRDFFWSLVELLEADEGKAILEYFNHEIFGAAETDETDTAAVGQAQGASSFNRLKEQRAAKQAVAAQAALAAAQAALAASA
ncbi:hypothetical protein BV25DRAFT_1818252 [Artomyces pyxidatus]|uniref:Uncharacterized protein n=1 Tax=Artomyces pyxidatus TaxID=48021 RepID=A0ACB8TLC4_9AGAM|nr:hypothetical protein BV25DRAFT_1818252 [Artomyces pyxidatus]